MLEQWSLPRFQLVSLIFPLDFTTSIITFLSLHSITLSQIVRCSHWWVECLSVNSGLSPAPQPILLAHKSRKISCRFSLSLGSVQSAPQVLIKPSPRTLIWSGRLLVYLDNSVQSTSCPSIVFCTIDLLLYLTVSLYQVPFYKQFMMSWYGHKSSSCATWRSISAWCWVWDFS